jgi:hypothetical protein
VIEKTSYRQLYCGIIDTVKAQLTNQFSEILNLKFVPLPDFGNFKRYSGNFPATFYESSLKSYGIWFSSEN